MQVAVEADAVNPAAAAGAVTEVATALQNDTCSYGLCQTVTTICSTCAVQPGATVTGTAPQPMVTGKNATCGARVSMMMVLLHQQLAAVTQTTVNRLLGCSGPSCALMLWRPVLAECHRVVFWYYTQYNAAICTAIATCRLTATVLDSQLTFPLLKSKHLLALPPFNHVVLSRLRYICAAKPPTLPQLSCCCRHCLFLNRRFC